MPIPPKFDQHSLICAIKDLAVELQKTPSYDDFRAKHGETGVARVFFGSWTGAIQAAGLKPLKAKKINNDIFKRDIEKHLEEYVPRSVIERKPYPTLATISDIHWPFANSRVVNRFLEFVGDTKPEWVILNGDAWDMYSLSKYPRSHNLFTPRDEENLSRQFNVEFWQAVRKASPRSKCRQMMGNHDIRAMKRVIEEFPEAEDWIKERLSRMFTFEGVETIFDPRQELFITEDVIVFHGYRTQLGSHRDYTLLNCINGHTHRGGAVFRRIRGQTLWELNSGVAGDPESKGLSYTPQKITEWTPGFGVLDPLGPRFVPV